MLVWIWVLTILGALLAWIMMLADAMSSGPRIPLGLAAVALPLPLIALGLASMGMHDLIRAGASLRSYIAIGVPLFLSFCTIAFWLGFFLPKSG